MKNQILFVEDSELTSKSAKKALEAGFPNHNIHTAENGRAVDKLLDNGTVSLENIAIVCTDGSLGSGTTGWGVVEKLRDNGYQGPALYTGGTTLPADKEHLYSGKCGKPFSGNDLVEAVRKYI